MADIHLHIERMNLEGIDMPITQHGELQAALTAELTRLLAEGGLSPSLAQGGAYDQAPTDRMILSDQPQPDTMGRQIAQSIYGGIGG